MRIALLGYARSGKDTVCDLIAKNYGGTILQLAFGEALRNSFHSLFDIPKNPKPRKEYEAYGEAMRRIDEDVWVKKVADAVDFWGDFVVPVITDLRQPNEHKWCKENGFIIVKVEATDSIREERSTNDTTFVPVNYSERNIENLEYDYLITNNGTMDQLEKEILKLLERIKTDGQTSRDT